MRPSGLLRRVSSSALKPSQDSPVQPFASHSSANSRSSRSASPTKSKSSSLDTIKQGEQTPLASGRSGRDEEPIASASANSYAALPLVQTPELDNYTDEASPTLVDSSAGSTCSSSVDEHSAAKATEERPSRAKTRLLAPPSRPELGVFPSSTSPMRPSLRFFGGPSSEALRGWAMRQGSPMPSPAISEDEKAPSFPSSNNPNSSLFSRGHRKTGSASLQRAEMRRWMGRTRRWRATLTSWRGLAGVALVLFTIVVLSRGDNSSAHLDRAKSWLPAVGLPWQIAPGRGGVGGVVTMTVTKSASSTSKPKPKKKPRKPDNPLALGSIPRRIKYGANLISKIDPESGEEEDDNSLLNKIPTKAERNLMFKEAEEEYYDEADYWKSYEWTPPRLHRSLQAVLLRLTPEEQSLRRWIKALRTTRSDPPSNAVGLVSPGSNLWEETKPVAVPLVRAPSPSEEEIEDVLIEVDLARPPEPEPETVEEVPVKLPEFTGGSIDKWSRLLEESQSEHGGVCQGSTWLESYRALHAGMLEGHVKPKLISYHCEKGMNCGGLGDRLLGMTSAFFYALVTKRAFLAEWQTPVPLDTVFDSPEVDWSFSTFASQRAHPVLSNDSLVAEQADLDIIHFNKVLMDKTFGTTSWDPPATKTPRLTKGMELRDLAFASRWIRFFSNRGMVYKSFAYPQLQSRIEQLGLKPMTAFSCILNYLFRPKPPVQNLIAEYTSVLSLPSVFSVGVQIRTGDMSMRDPIYDRRNTVKTHGAFFECADQLAETYALPGQKVVYFLVTDSAHLRENALTTYGEKVVISGAEIEHIHVRDGHANGVHNAVLEEWILAKTDYRVITQDSGFGKLASFASGQRASTVTIVSEGNADTKVKGAKKAPQVDCRLEGAFTTFDQLSAEWSLG